MRTPKTIPGSAKSQSPGRCRVMLLSLPSARDHASESGSGVTSARFAQCLVPPITDTAHTTQAVCGDAWSGFAGDGDLKGFANLTHSLIAESAKALDERSERDALDGVEVDDRCPRDGVLAGLEQHLTRDTADGGCARADQRPSKPRNRRVSREHHDRPPPDLSELAPPDLSVRRNYRHDAPAADRNEARFPHSSSASSGTRSYAA